MRPLVGRLERTARASSGRLASGVLDVDDVAFDASAHGWVLWDLFVFEPWFLVEGLLFVAAGAATMRTDRSHRRWVAGCVAATGVATATGLLGLRL